jgi:hypothetical protein
MRRPNDALAGMWEDDEALGIDPTSASPIVEHEPRRPPRPFVIEPPDWLGADA